MNSCNRREGKTEGTEEEKGSSNLTLLLPFTLL